MLFTPKKVETASSVLEKLQGESLAILGLFEQTVEDLNEVSTKIDEQVAIIDSEVKALEATKSSSLAVKERNLKIANRIDQFLNS